MQLAAIPVSILAASYINVSDRRDKSEIIMLALILGTFALTFTGPL